LRRPRLLQVLPYDGVAMENADLLLLARAQFGLNIGFHILFPSLTIALGWILLFFRIQYARTGDAAWLATYNLWTKIFALSFAMGVVSGIVLSYQFGTNWSRFSAAACLSESFLFCPFLSCISCAGRGGLK
jgi:cytochrome bd-type quinol oxidase subunit 1